MVEAIAGVVDPLIRRNQLISAWSEKDAPLEDAKYAPTVEAFNRQTQERVAIFEANLQLLRDAFLDVYSDVEAVANSRRTMNAAYSAMLIAPKEQRTEYVVARDTAFQRSEDIKASYEKEKAPFKMIFATGLTYIITLDALKNLGEPLHNETI